MELIKVDIFKVIKERRSIRAYKSELVSDEKLKRVLEAARLAPSACNKQPWKFFVVRDEGLKQKLVAAARGQTFIGEAPVVIVACGLMSESYGEMGGYMKSWVIDVAIAMEHLILVAASLGLGTCWIGAFDEGRVKEILGLGKDMRVLALTPLGRPAEEGVVKGLPVGRQGRKRMEEIVEWR